MSQAFQINLTDDHKRIITLDHIEEIRPTRSGVKLRFTSGESFEVPFEDRDGIKGERIGRAVMSALFQSMRQGLPVPVESGKEAIDEYIVRVMREEGVVEGESEGDGPDPIACCAEMAALVLAASHDYPWSRDEKSNFLEAFKGTCSTAQQAQKRYEHLVEHAT